MNTLPGNLTSPRAGPILCRCAPAIVVKTGRRGIVDFVAVDANEHRPGTWARFLYDDDGEERGGYVWGADPLPEPRPLDVIRLAAISLDLDDPAGVDLAARWLARHHGLTVGATAPTWSSRECHEDWGGLMWILTGVHAGSPFGDHILFSTTSPIECRESWRTVTGISAIADPLEALVAACVHAGGASR